MDERGITADKVHSAFYRTTVENRRKFFRTARSCGYKAHRSDGYTLVYYRNTRFARNLVGGFYQRPGFGIYFFVNVFTRSVDISADTVEKGYTHRDGTNVEMLRIDHTVRF